MLIYLEINMVKLFENKLWLKCSYTFAFQLYVKHIRQ